mmetsp:Transcript_33310/g.78498  ORF Transcript_33310/g.78498 Transcript_33310/m.78498 type:complete len:236 (+) Transcript_33310:860-1567(+)
MLETTLGGMVHLSWMKLLIFAASWSATSPLVAAASKSDASFEYSGREDLALASIAPNGSTQPGGALKSCWFLSAIVRISAAAEALAPHTASLAWSLGTTLVLEVSMLEESTTGADACCVFLAATELCLSATCPDADTSSSTVLPMLEAMPLRIPLYASAPSLQVKTTPCWRARTPKCDSSGSSWARTMPETKSGMSSSPSAERSSAMIDSSFECGAFRMAAMLSNSMSLPCALPG